MVQPEAAADRTGKSHRLPARRGDGLRTRRLPTAEGLLALRSLITAARRETMVLREVSEVWVTLYGARVHTAHDCQGIIDGHTVARGKGLRNHPPELWPVHLALTWPNRDVPRGKCQRCWSGFSVSDAPDNPSRVQQAKSGPIGRLLDRPSPQRLDDGPDSVPAGEFGLNTAPEPLSWIDDEEYDRRDVEAVRAAYDGAFDDDDI